MKTNFKNTSQRGSALLIVLGFLSFMLISAVSFAVYMRIERQASSNYRHAVTGRHLLNAALYRAIDEIDSELRIVNEPLKFPDWPGRTRPSAVPNGADNAQEARVLSMEALSFIPGIFVNDVRRYAVTNSADVVNLSGAPADKRISYLGTKWRKLSMPVASISGGENAYEEAVVGRYAYMCVNLSDMLNVNVCKAAVRDASTNRVGIGYLFASDANRTTFDANKNTDKHYDTLQDFYACMSSSGHNDPTFGSPYHDYLKDGDDSSFNYIDNPQIMNNILVTDGIAKAQPALGTACNIFQQQPVAPSLLTQSRPAGGDVVLQSDFEAKLAACFGGSLSPGAKACMAAQIADYLDTDSRPKLLNMPSVEMVPMVSQIVLNKTKFRARVYSQPTADTPPKMQYGIKLIGDSVPGSQLSLSVEVVWPFKYFEERTIGSFKAKAIMCFKLITKPMMTLSGGLSLTEKFALISKPDAAFSTIAPFSQVAIQSDQNNCYHKVTLIFDAPSDNDNKMMLLQEPNNPLNGFNLTDQVRVLCYMLVQVINGNNEVVDQVPCALDGPGMDGDTAVTMWKQNTPKIYFQTAGVAVGDLIAKNGTYLEYEKNSLEIADPRFNSKAADWISGDEPSNEVDAKKNKSTSDILADNTGRDGDIFMSVADSGKMQSPGELGFILRPFNWDPMGGDVNLMTQNAYSQIPAVDQEAMFRTIRLYDHGQAYPRDKVYDYFTAQNPDGTVAGARVNPLSDVTNVLVAAVEDTPLDYWVASRDPSSDVSLMQNNSFTKKISQADWKAFRGVWAQCLIRARSLPGKNISNSLGLGLSDVYGDWDKFGWYSAGNPKKIFSAPGVAPASVSTIPGLHEIDRKMLFSFSLDSFSDRQQLFLYILRAESTVPSFGGGQQEGGMKSLAGGRAVALVWRDPYPTGFDKASPDGYPKKDYLTPNRVSPWYQVNRKKYDDSMEAYSQDAATSTRTTGFNEHRILFFKQLDN